MNRKEALLEAADLIEVEGRYNFNTTHIPLSLGDCGCVLGWIGYYIGFGGLGQLGKTAKWLGYKSSGQFYDDMTRVCGDNSWTDYGDRAAAALRDLAEGV